MLPVDVVLCMLGQYRVFPPLALIMATRLHGMLATRRCRCSTGIFAHLSSRAWRSSPIFWGGLSILMIARLKSSQIFLWGCSLAILPAAQSWGHCLAEGNIGLPEQGEVWRYHLGSGSYPRNIAWQMALRCFAKCPCRANRSGFCQGAHEMIWHHCEKLSRRVPNHHQLGPYKPVTFAGSAHQVNNVP